MTNTAQWKAICCARSAQKLPTGDLAGSLVCCVQDYDNAHLIPLPEDLSVADLATVLDTLRKRDPSSFFAQVLFAGVWRPTDTADTATSLTEFIQLKIIPFVRYSGGAPCCFPPSFLPYYFNAALQLIADAEQTLEICCLAVEDATRPQ